MKILGISAYYHDAAAAILVDGHIVAAAQEERFTRIKHDPSFPEQAICYCLKEACLRIDDLDAVVFYDKPFLKFERLLESYMHFAPLGLLSFLKAIPVWIQEKLFIKNRIRKGLGNIDSYDKKKLKLLFTSHHLSHAASAFFASPFNEACILTVDGVGEWATASIAIGEGHQIRTVRELHFPHSVGLFYSAFTFFLGFRVNSGEYKLMGLAPYGNAVDPQTENFRELIRTKLVRISDDGSIRLNLKYFSFPVGLRMIPARRWEKLFSILRLRPGLEPEQAHCNLALAVQQVTEEIILKMAAQAASISGLKKLCLAGGVALNCVANGKILGTNLFQDFFIQPAAGDAGGAVGAALAAHHMYFQQERRLDDHDLMHGAYLGPAVRADELPDLKMKFKAVYHALPDFEQTAILAADCIGKGLVTGWVQGRMEFGPRALGNRSILADATSVEMQKKLNLKIKYREGFRPFAPSVALEEAHEYFNINVPSPYMLLTAQIRDKYRQPLPENHQTMTLAHKLYYHRSLFQAVTHVDFSARLHTVDRQTNERFHQLLLAVKKQCGHALVVNTSFNVRGEPIVCTAEDAYRCFMNTEMDVLFIDRFVFYKEEQFNFEDRNFWKQNFLKD